MKTGIIIICYNIPSEIFTLQIKAIQKYCKDDFVIEVFDNSNDGGMAEAVRYHSELMGVKYKKLYSSQGGPSDSHSWAANFSYDKLKEDYDYFFYLDHDCVPVADFSVQEILKDKLYAGIAQKNPTYLWPGCFMFSNIEINPDLIDFRPNHELTLDTGGNLYKLLEFYGKDKAVFFKEEYHQNPHYQGRLYTDYAMIQDTFMHFIAGSNWVNLEGHQERINGLISVLKEKTQL